MIPTEEGKYFEQSKESGLKNTQYLKKACSVELQGEANKIGRVAMIYLLLT